MAEIRFIDDIAKRKMTEGWIPYRWERVGGGVIVTGGVPIGKKKDGRPRFGPKRTDTSVIVSDEAIKAEEEKYVADTGNCVRCLGKGEIMWRWSIGEGKEFRPCRDCVGTGKAKGKAI